MKNAVQKSLQGWAGNRVRGWTVRFGSLAIGTACCVLVLSQTSASAASGSAVTQLKYLQTLVQLCGESGSFTASSKPADYVQWAKNKNMNLNWDTKAKLSSDVLAQSLVQLYGLNPRKYGGDYIRILEREGIIIAPGSTVSSEALASLVDNPVVVQRTFQVAGASTSPIKPGNGNGGGYGWYEHQAGIPKPPPHDRGLGLGRGHLPRPR